MKKLSTIEFLNYPKMIPAVLAYVDEILRFTDMDKARSMKFRIACEEIIAKRVAGAFEGEGSLYADISLSQTQLEFAIRDKGEPYWVTGSEYNPDLSETGELSGLEYYMVFNMADSAGLEKLGREGQRFFIRNLLNLNVEPIKTPPETHPPKDTDFRVVTVCEDAEINEAMSCIYNEYGYTYSYEQLYFTESFKRMIEAGFFNSFLIANDHGEIAGHYGLACTDTLKGMPEVCTVVVKRNFRGLGIANTMFAEAVNSARELGGNAVCSQPTAFHTGTQHICIKLGFTATGFLFYYVNSDVQSEYNKTGTRLDLTMCVKLFNPMTYKVYCPDEITAFTGKILDRVGMTGEFLPSQPATGESEVEMSVNNRALSAKITVTRAGTDFEASMQSMMKSFEKMRVEMAELMLLLEDSSAPHAYDVLKNMGFIFTGVLPGSEKGVYCVMQHLFGSEPNFDSVVTKGDYTEILHDIKSIYSQNH